MNVNENRLLEDAQKGNVKAFEKLIESYQKKVFNIALSMVGNYDDASELAQEVFIRVFKSIKSFKGEAAFTTWIYRITANICFDYLRKIKNKSTISLDDEIKLENGNIKRQLEDDGLTPEMQFEQKEIKKQVTDAIKLLPEDYRISIILRDIQGLSYSEISTYLKCPEGTVKSRINRARQALRDILKKEKELLYDYYVK